jgi:hypothetical protein
VSEIARFRFAGLRSAIEATRRADAGKKSTPFRRCGVDRHRSRGEAA